MDDQNGECCDPAASASGIVECLRMLAAEAAELRMSDTLHALQEAIAVCEFERGKVAQTDAPGLRFPSDTVRH